ncbi:hypothetical protein [Cellulophaga sp. Hel_I_12]|uniref:hypothetical protein n=1 Tax=Cellulophaga sp. Hel_I_12 TaxID=1249972 RepID=UPI000647BEF0|nr:hypothetical protein [Cellulophaga sp. Hel_I_12]
MEIRIFQKRWNIFFDRYEILVDNNLMYYAKSKPFSFYSQIGLEDLDNYELLSVKREPNLTDFLNYSINYGLSNSIEIRSESAISYNIRISKGTIYFHEQKSNAIAIFLNEKHIGIISKNHKKILGEDKYLIKLEKYEIDPLIVIAFTLAYDNKYHNDTDSVVTYDYDNIVINPEKEIDLNWEPKE